MTDLTLTPNLDRPDDFYAALIAAHDGLSDDESSALNARLILILANQIGDHAVLTAALRTARTPAGEDAAA
ncbi:DUF2783 domain-containing protein [Mameliella sediminis]|uniref:DUF2783 domain-containing protein n=1 Tax=Mameliella sediminis TaxID=2836866 RepID=UPI001C43E2F9|nr:DUF2783 domain-containing protein [Mameliella sediminis]MBY6116689.1 DUF2783 domain-containing protein [Antarctobacter heliothermus]MBY6146442.1 DUF2783 domain-containing protein [Mameliella alba]MBV7396782.1 DUF2783 domain-containing protein [Mameliella sediminis]MBY6163073.1 DUF2783 domain-containing protein [Mameliella alba]MBY6171337.1 DUF2783 domain-containing protein [Mameliella alba]